MVQFTPSLLQILFIFFVPESPRFLINKGKEQKALSILAKVHANGNENDEMVQCEYIEIRDTLRLEKEVESNIKTIGKDIDAKKVAINALISERDRIDQKRRELDEKLRAVLLRLGEAQGFNDLSLVLLTSLSQVSGLGSRVAGRRCEL